MSIHRFIVLSVLVAACAGCATRTPVAQVRLVGKAFEDLNGASAPLFDDLSIAERTNGKNAAESRARKRTDGAAPTPAVEDRCAGFRLAPAGKVSVEDG